MILSNMHVQKNADIPVKLSGNVARQETIRVADALRDNRIELHYQPIIRSNTNDFVAFFEGLARIRMNDGTIISAGQFMPFVENTPLGRALDCVTLQCALNTLAENPNIRLSVNLSPYSMTDPKWMNIFESCSTDLGERLILEITEGAAMSDIEMTTAFMHRARRSGCSIALDDFGTGSTAFRYFKDFRFDIVKIDGLFIRDLQHNKDNRVLVEALVKISEHFGMFSVAEFIETEGEANMATELGIDCLQGYLIGKPSPKLELPNRTLKKNQNIAG